jgi:hypothetical protein
MGCAPEIAVAYLARSLNGIEVFESFLDAYRSFDSGVEHELIIIFKGFDEDRRGVREYQERLSGLPYRAFFFPDVGFDIGAYLAVARSFPHEFFCFLNSYSAPLDSGWLKKLHSHAPRRGVGVVGATGSYESHYTACETNYTACRRTNYGPVMYARCMAGHLLRGRERPSAARYLAWQRELRAMRWELSALRRHYPPFPNPHVRTNAFLMPREVLLGLEVGPIADKWAAMRFESGRAGLTRQVLAMGLRPLVVGRDGLAYEKERWPESRTYRAGAQENLLVSDNRTRQYAEADPETRRSLAAHAWGDEAVDGE